MGLCESMHSYDATIDLADRDTSKHDKPCAGGSCYGLAYERLDWPVTMNCSFVIQVVIQVVIQAVIQTVPADSARGQRAIKIGCPLRVNGVRGSCSQSLGGLSRRQN